LENVHFDNVQPTLFLRAIWVMALPATPGTTWGQDWLLDAEYMDAHVSMIERLARAAR
jgi:hypothetical protein